MLHYCFKYRDYYGECVKHKFEASSDLDAIKKAKEFLNGSIDPENDILYRFNLEDPRKHYYVKLENYENI